MALMEDVTRAINGLSAALADPVPDVTPIANPNGQGQLVVVRDGYTVEPLPGKMKGRRLHTFHDLGSFADWLIKYAKPDKAEILAGEAEVQAALDPTDPTGDLATCKLTFHPSFDAWRGIFGKACSQKALHSFIRGQAGALISTAPTLAAEVRSLQAISGGDFEARLDERGFYQVDSASRKIDLKSKIPSAFNIEIPVYIGVMEAGEERQYAIEILLSMDITDGSAIFVLSCPALPVYLHTARLDAVEYLRSLAPGFLIGLGSLKIDSVPVTE